MRLFKGRKTLLIIIAAVVALLVPISVFAATSDTATAKSIRGFFGINPSTLNDAQKADVTDYANKFAQLQKDFIDKMVSNGALTKDQGDAAKAKIDAALKAGNTEGLLGGLFGRGGARMKAAQGLGMFGLGKVDLSKLTADQKTAVQDIQQKMKDVIKANPADMSQQMITLEKQLVSKLLEFKVITQTQADAANKAIDQNKGLCGIGGMGGLNKAAGLRHGQGKGGKMQQLPSGNSSGANAT